MKIFSILDEFDLTKPKNRVKRLMELDKDELNSLVEALSASLEDKESLTINEQTNPWDLWLPFFSNATLEQVPSYLFAFDKVYILDPLMDYFCELQDPNVAAIENASRIFEERKERNEELPELAKYITPTYLKILNPMFDKASWESKVREISAQKIDKTINYYLKYKELIQENVLIPFVDLKSDYSDYLVGSIYMTENLIAETAEKYSLWERLPSDEIEKNKNNLQGLINLFDEIMPIFWSDISEITHFMPSAISLKSTFPSKTYSSITFGDDKNKILLDRAIASLSKSLKGATTESIKWPTENDEIIFPSLSGVPSDHLLHIRQKEKDSFEKYRYYTQKKLVEMKAVAGTKDYTSLMRTFQIEQKAQVNEISLVYKNIKSNLQRKLTHHLGSITISVAATVLAALSTTTDPLALLGIGVGSSGTMIGIEKLIEDWITFQSEKDKLKEKDTYVLWRIHQ